MSQKRRFGPRYENSELKRWRETESEGEAQHRKT